jgi:5-methyltetrahydropteroyltriglutamate--homocysteine methyltransferase
MAPHSLPLLVTSVVGSYSIPSWLTVALEQIRQGRFGRFDIRETLDDAVTVAMDDQVRAGVDVIADGEMRRQDFIMSFYDRLAGLKPTEPARKIGVPFYDRMTVYITVDRITAPTGLGIVEEFRFARARTDRPLKVTCPGPLTLTTSLKIAAPYKDPLEAVEDIGKTVRTELELLVDSGADFIQIDEPAFHPLFAREPKEVVALFNRTVDGLRAKVAMHICFGNLYGRPRTRRTYAPILPHIQDLKADQLVLEFANRELAELDLWRKFGGDKELAAGLIDIKSFHPDAPEEVAERIRITLQRTGAPPQRLWIVPDCGFCFVPRWLAFAKMKAMVDGARIVRRELGG